MKNPNFPPSCVTADATESLANQLAGAQAELDEKRHALERMQAEVVELEQHVEKLQDQLAVLGGGPDAEFQALWSSLLNTLNPDPLRYDKLDQALRALMVGRHVMARPSYRVRTDNRQTVLTLFVPSDDSAFEALASFVRRLLPVVVNTQAESEDGYAAILEVVSRTQSDKELLTLTANPRQSCYQLWCADRFEERLEFESNTLRAMMAYLKAHRHY